MKINNRQARIIGDFLAAEEKRTAEMTAPSFIEVPSHQLIQRGI